ncbi:HhH-GPD family protein [Nostocoides australiense]|nr:A/G-specific adenine glycosylase [Tetrasphaera australiensis]HRW02446.1 A/G-specific adenine glycosylase [Tetrasphaera sp.]
MHRAVLQWYAVAGRDLPWREPSCSPWGVFVSEVMAQQTPIARILPAWQAWLRRWPTPADLAAAPVGEAIRAWDRLGYPRRAVNLHAAARAMVERHDGHVPSDPEELRALPGVGDYTAAAVSSFAFGNPLVVIDTNVRRVLVRIALGQAQAAPSLTKAERELAATWQPRARSDANAWNVAAMELGALVCTARAPRCSDCPVAALCAWHQAGNPAYDGPARGGQGYEGTDRQLRGRILALLRAADHPLEPALIEALDPDPERVRRLVGALAREGLLEHSRSGYHLPR